MYFIKLAQVSPYQLAHGFGDIFRIMCVYVRAHNGKAFQQVSAIDKNCNLDHFRVRPVRQ